MESSAISLYFSLLRRASPEAEPTQQEYLINLIDSPGHIDFSSEVSTASRLCDGAVVLVDAVEGVCSQTITVLRQTWIEKLKPLLVINKMDRLITELKMSPGEAYTHLSQLLEQVNAIMGSFFQGERMEDDLKWREMVEERVKAASARLQEKADGAKDPNGIKQDTDGIDATSTPAEYEEKDDENIYFAPEKNNVIFSSAIDGWAFTVKQFAGLYDKKLSIKRSVLEKVLWGDFYLDPKTKRVLGSKHLKGRHLKPMFVQLVLENIWAAYEATTGGSNGKGDPMMLEKITKSLNITIPLHILRSRDPRALLTTVFASWLPLSTALLVSVIESLPSPPSSQATRMPDLLDGSPGAEHIDPKVRDAMVQFRTDRDAPIVAYVSKMVSVPESELPQNKWRGRSSLSAEEARELARKKRAEFAKARAAENEGSDGVERLTSAMHISSIEDEDRNGVEEEIKEDPEHLIGFARLYSGTLNVGDEVYVLPPKFSPSHPHSPPVPPKVRVQQLYLLMGRSMEILQTVPAGVVFGIEGLAGHVLKSGTLCTQLEGGVNLAGVNLGSQPIVRVALEPENPADLDKMIKGLKMLEESDPCAIYEMLESGEHVLATAGELHLERCLKDLRERFARCEIQAGEPIVPYRESIVSAQEMNPPRDKALPRGTVLADTSSNQVQIRLRVRPLPAAVTDFLNKHAAAIKKLYDERRAEEEGKQRQEAHERDVAEASEDQDGSGNYVAVESSNILPLAEFKKQLQEAFASAKGEREVWNAVIDKIAAFGPRRTGANMLIDATGLEACGRILREGRPKELSDEGTIDSLTARDFADKVIYAFQLATLQGSLCSESVQGIAVFLESIKISTPTDETSSARENLGRVTGEVIRTVRESIRAGFLDWSPRILLAMYSCEIQCSTEVLGRVYGVITRRRGRILSEAMKEGTPFFSILALLPVAESFGFSAEIRQRTGGLASPQLRFKGFEALDEDPFWVPWTEEELEDLGETADKENVAKKYVDAVRKRKGLFVGDKKAATNAEKQKTLKR